MIARRCASATPLAPPQCALCVIRGLGTQGVTWVTDSLIVAVSDRMKGGGRQPARCAQKDQSIHVFSLPETWQAALQAELESVGAE
jgi:hypothetical protein